MIATKTLLYEDVTSDKNLILRSGNFEKITPDFESHSPKNQTAFITDSS